MDVVGVEHARLDELVDLGDRDAPGHARERVEVAGRLLEAQVAVPVADRGTHEAEVGADGPLEHVLAGAAERVERAQLLRVAGERHGAVGGVAERHAAVGDRGARTRRGVERRDADAARAQPLGERALRGELDLDLAAEVLAGELLVLADVRRDHPADAAGGEQLAEAPAVDAAVVRDHLEVARALREQRPDEHDRHAREAEAADGERRSVGDVGDGLGGARVTSYPSVSSASRRSSANTSRAMARAALAAGRPA